MFLAHTVQDDSDSETESEEKDDLTPENKVEKDGAILVFNVRSLPSGQACSAQHLFCIFLHARSSMLLLPASYPKPLTRSLPG